MNASNEPDRIATLRRELEETANEQDLTQEMLGVASIVQELLEPIGLKPVVVGGLALACWVSEDRYLTGDIDVAMPTTEPVTRLLEGVGFEREGRFWILPGREIFLEAPESQLRPDADGHEEVELPSGRRVLVQTAEGVLIIRMEELAGAPHSETFEQCLWLVGSGEIDYDTVTRLSERTDLLPILNWLMEQADTVSAGGRLPEPWEIKETVERLLRS